MASSRYMRGRGRPRDSRRGAGATFSVRYFCSVTFFGVAFLV